MPVTTSARDSFSDVFLPALRGNHHSEVHAVLPSVFGHLCSGAGGNLLPAVRHPGVG